MTTNGITKIAQTVSIKPTHDIVRDIILVWLHKAGFKSVTQIDSEKPLHELGIDSLGIMEIAMELESSSGKTMNPDMVYELETISEIAEYVDSLSATVAEPALPASTIATPVEPSAADPDEPALLARYQLLNRRVTTAQQENRYFFEPVISKHDGVWVEVEGQRMLMLASYEYLGLLNDQLLKDAAIRTIQEFGTGHHGARLLTGTTTVHRQLEDKLSKLMGTHDAIVFSSGYVTNLAVISALVGPGDCVIGDQLNHASIVDGCRMSGATFETFAHNDINDLEACLQRNPSAHTLVVVDGVFSMDGDIAPIPEIVALCRRYKALLMVDEAHSLGVLGKNGGGVQEHFNLKPRDIDIKMGTLSKSFSCSGGFVAASDEIVCFLRHHARGYIFSGALSAAHANAAIAAIDRMQNDPSLVRSLWRNVDLYCDGLRSLGFDIGNTVSPIVPIMTADIETTLDMTAFCSKAGLLVMPVCFPAVPLDAPRLRTCVSAAHSADEIRFALDVLAKAGLAAGLIE